MRRSVVVIMLCAFVLTMMPMTAVASSQDDIKWIARCMMDNKDEGASAEVVRKYCECMNSKMDETETRSITQWEKANPKARKECERVAGWR